MSQFIVRVPTRTGKPGKWEGIFQSGKSQGILNRLEKSGKITQNTGKLREFQTNIICYFLVIFKLTVYYFAKMHQVFSLKNKLLKNTGKWKKYWKSQGILSVRKSGNPDCVTVCCRTHLTVQWNLPGEATYLAAKGGGGASFQWSNCTNIVHCIYSIVYFNAA